MCVWRLHGLPGAEGLRPETALTSIDFSLLFSSKPLTR